MKKLPFYEVATIRDAENDRDKKVAILADGRLMIYEFVSRENFQGIRKHCDDYIIGHLTHGGDVERVYTIFEMFFNLGQYITPGFYPPRDDS